MATISKKSSVRREAAEQSTAAAAKHIRPSEVEWGEFERHFNLSPRQLQVAKLLYADCPAKALARRLGCAPGTANAHRAKLYAKLNVHDRTGLLREILEFCIARRSGGSLPPPD